MSAIVSEITRHSPTGRGVRVTHSQTGLESGGGCSWADSWVLATLGCLFCGLEPSSSSQSTAVMSRVQSPRGLAWSLWRIKFVGSPLPLSFLTIVLNNPPNFLPLSAFPIYQGKQAQRVPLFCWPFSNHQPILLWLLSRSLGASSRTCPTTHSTRSPTSSS